MIEELATTLVPLLFTSRRKRIDRRTNVGVYRLGRRAKCSFEGVIVCPSEAIVSEPEAAVIDALPVLERK